MYAWKQGLKTTYYLRSRPATRIAKATIAGGAAGASAAVGGTGAAEVVDAAQAVSCSLENPSVCEACQ